MLGWIGSQPMGMAYAKARKTGGGWAGSSEVGGESGDEGESGDAGSGTLRTSGFTCGGGAAAGTVRPDGRTAVRREAAREKPEVFAEHTWPSLVGLPTCGAAVLGEAEASRLLPELDSEVAVANGSRAAVGEAVGDAAPFTTLRNWEMQGVRDGAGRDLQILGRE